ncbi:hypothetical protein VTK56DRAFT_551 [Thermocarpiscus australiensis]
MPPKMAKAAGAGDAPKQPTTQEAFLFFTIIKNMKGKPEIDWNAVAADNGFKNADTAKVRYGQIKRKLGLDNYTNAKAAKNVKDEDVAGGNDTGLSMPETPATARSKKAAGTPSTPGAATGAGVKKRANSGSAKRATGGRGRKPKAEEIIKMEDNDDNDLAIIDSPSIHGTASRIKRELNAGASEHDMNSYVEPEFVNFPAVIPPMVLERQAVLVNFNGSWMVSPVSLDIHAQWLARLPAHIQTRFYTQAQAYGASRNGNNGNNGNTGNGSNNNSYIAAQDDDTAAQAQLLCENIHAQTSAQPTHGLPMPMSMPGNGNGNKTKNKNKLQFQLPPIPNTNIPMPIDMAINMGYLPADAAAGNDNGNGNGHADLHSIPFHPGYVEQLQREREQEEQDKQELFGGGNGADIAGGGAGWV